MVDIHSSDSSAMWGIIGTSIFVFPSSSEMMKEATSSHSNFGPEVAPRTPRHVMTAILDAAAHDFRFRVVPSAHRDQFTAIVKDAASVGRLTKLVEATIETVSSCPPPKKQNGKYSLKRSLWVAISNEAASVGKGACARFTSTTRLENGFENISSALSKTTEANNKLTWSSWQPFMALSCGLVVLATSQTLLSESLPILMPQATEGSSAVKIAMTYILLLAFFQYCYSSNPTKQVTTTMSESASVAGTEASSVASVESKCEEDINDEARSDTSKNMNEAAEYDLMVAAPQETDDEDVVDAYDLSKYESLPVFHLRNLLRQGEYQTAGEKSELIHRLASGYKAELAALSVEQLMPMLESMGLNQDGSKPELIRRLVEAGVC